jgi:hypothetical protein
MRELISAGFLTPYRIFAPECDLDLSDVDVTGSGDYSPPKLKTAVRKSHLIGDVVKWYLQIAPGKLGLTFASDIESATNIARTFRDNGVPAEVVTGKTPDLLRAQIFRRFRNREILQLVSVDILGEGVDIPAIEVVSFARPTMSYGLFVQQFGRALRILEGKSHAIIIDHVGNVISHNGIPKHGVPDAPRNWTLDRRERRAASSNVRDDAVPLRTCLNPECISVYEKYLKACPYCGTIHAPASRSTIEQVDGDPFELSEETLAKLRGEIKRVRSDTPAIPYGATPVIAAAVTKNHRQRQQASGKLEKVIQVWAGYHKDVMHREDDEIRKRFYHQFEIDVLTAQTVSASESEELRQRVLADLKVLNVEYDDGVVESTVTDAQVVASVRAAQGTDPRALLEMTTGQAAKVCLKALQRAMSRDLIGYTSDWSLCWLTTQGAKL